MIFSKRTNRHPVFDFVDVGYTLGGVPVLHILRKVRVQQESIIWLQPRIDQMDLPPHFEIENSI